jgi:hypothetical protein
MAQKKLSFQEFYDKIYSAYVTLGSNQENFDLSNIEVEFHVDDRSEGTTIIASQLDEITFNLIDRNSKLKILIS